MRKIQKTSMLICMALVVVFGSGGIILKWPLIEQWLQSGQKPATTQAPESSVDPFYREPPLASVVLDLHPTYKITSELHTNEATITGNMTVAFDNPGTADLRFYVYDYPDSPIQIRSIRNGKQSLPFKRSGSVIVLQNPQPKASRLSLAVQFQTAVPRSGTRFGVKDDIWTLTTWYPMLGSLNQAHKWYEPPKRIGFGDPFVYHYADYDVTFVSPEGYQWVSTWGQGTAKKLDQGRKEVHYQAKRVINFSLVGSPLFHVQTLKYGSLTVDVASTVEGNLKRIKTIADAVFPLYARLFGPLPYPHVAIAEVNTYTHAMEYANMAIFRKDLYAKNLIDHWLPHEIGHMWWYNNVETLEADTGWIDEGMAEMAVYFYEKNRYGQSAADSVLNQYKQKLERLQKNYPYGKLAKSLHQFQTDDEFDSTWYGEGALLYNYLREQIGDDKFVEFMKRVQSMFKQSVIAPQHLDQALGQTLRGEAHYFVPNVQRLNRAPFLPPRVQYYVDLMLNEVSFYPKTPARLINGTVYVPLREVMERLGYQIDWNAEKGAIQLRAGNHDLLLQQRSKMVSLNGKNVALPQPLLEYQEQTMVPLALFQDILQYRVQYDQQSRLVKIAVR
ncbi:stalk domain-containing protein [Brevibacillus fulvus]|uniref:Aminopeptidase n=1 Tax=Brevibacillus fulvus TaxID=1125967 RepID=A0A938XY19_9BACL|nr:stalk domain-containing protein [Brevibacillus fulvus]MBM7588546.1 hypothetical protein [Brevibacillus fulvus]